jgi:transposase
MKNRSITAERNTIGVDLGDRYSHYCVLDARGTVVERDRVLTKPRHIEELFSAASPARVVLEVGTHSPWVHRLIEELGHEVIVANPRQLRLIYGSKDKHDRSDSERLARLGRVDPELLHPIRHRSWEVQADLGVVRSRDALVRSRTLLVNHVRGAVKSAGGRIPSGFCPSKLARKANSYLPDELRGGLEPVLRVITMLTAQIRELDREIERLCRERYSETERLRQVRGVGPITALTFVLTIQDPDRFPRSRDVGPYLGLTPRRSASGKRDPELPITKAGDRYLRCLLVQCAHYILGPFGEDSDLRRWGEELSSRGKKNAKKRAAVAVARKLSVLLHTLWRSGEVYEPLRNSDRKEPDAA